MLAQLAIVVVLGRVLGPDRYAAVALAIIVVNLIAVGSFGLKAAAIQEEVELDDELLDTVWTLDNLLRNILASAVILALSPLLSGLAGPNGSTAFFAALSLVPLAIGLENNAIVILTRSLRYRTRALIDIADALVTVAASIGFVAVMRSEWAYVAGFLAGSLARAAVAFALVQRIPRVRVAWGLALRLFRFGRWTALSALCSQATTQVSGLVVAGQLRPSGLSVYQIGSRIPGAVGALTSQISTRVLFPIIADRERRGTRDEAWTAHILVVVLFLLGLVGVTVALERAAVITLLLGPAWNGAVPVLAAASPAVVGIGAQAVLSSSAWGAGRERWQAGMMTLRFTSVVVIVACLAIVSQDPVRIALGVSAAEIAIGALMALMHARAHPEVLATLWATTCRVAVPAMAGGLVIWGTSTAADGWPPAARLSAAAPVLVAACLVVLFRSGDAPLERRP